MFIKTGNVLWLSDDDFSKFSFLDYTGVLFSGVKPLHTKEGTIALMSDRIVLATDSDETIIYLKDISQVYLGFDDLYKRVYAKNFGAFWQPLRLTFGSDTNVANIYLVIDFNFMSTTNQLWFDSLKDMLS